MSTATTFDHKSAELTARDTGEFQDPTVQNGRVRVARFSKTFASAPADAETLELFRLPNRAVILQGAISWTDMDSGAGTMHVGTDDGTADPDAIASALDISTAGSAALPEATANVAIVLDAPTSIYATFNEGTALATGTVQGYILYVENS